MARGKAKENAGTEIKFKIHIKPMGEIHMEDMDFTCEFYKSLMGREDRSKSVTIGKRDINMLKYDADNYVAIVDTGVFGEGDIICRIAVDIPDNSCSDGFRTEIQTIPTGETTY